MYFIGDCYVTMNGHYEMLVIINYNYEQNCIIPEVEVVVSGLVVVTVVDSGLVVVTVVAVVLEVLPGVVVTVVPE